MVSNLNISSKEARKISTSTTPSNLVINKFPNREVYEKIKAKGSLGKDDVNVLEDYGYTLTETDKTEIAGKVIADGTEFTLSEFPTALKNPAALTFAGAVTGTYDGSEALTITIPEGGSGGSTGGGLRKMSAVANYIGIPVAELPQDGTVWMCISKGDGAELYSGTVTIEGGSLMANNLIAVSSGSVIQLNQATTIGAGFVIYGMSATNYVGVWQEVGAGSAAINWRGEYSAQTAYNRLDAVSYESSSYVFASDTPTIGTIPGVDGEWQLLAQKGASGTDLSLGVTGATVGQIAKITAVDASGKPTAWEPVDMPSGGGETWEEIRTLEISEDIIKTTISTDNDGAPFSLKKIYIEIKVVPPTNTDITYNATVCCAFNGNDPWGTRKVNLGDSPKTGESHAILMISGFDSYAGKIIPVFVKAPDGQSTANFLTNGKGGYDSRGALSIGTLSDINVPALSPCRSIEIGSYRLSLFAGTTIKIYGVRA